MSSAAGHNTVTDGLVLCLDATDIKSYSGSGTTWYDRSTNGNNGTLTNGPIYSSADGGSIAFDGSNDYVNCGNNSTLNLSTFTSSSWVYPRNLSIRNNIVSKEQSANWVYAVGQVSNKITFWINNGSWIQQDSVSNITLNTWIYITVSYDGNIKKIYINDLFDSQQNASGMILNSSTPVAIGAQSQNFTASLLNANIAQVSIYNRALSQAEVLQNYNAQKARYKL